MSPDKKSFAMMPSVVDSVSVIPGSIGWGVERPHLVSDSKMIPIDTMIEEFPVNKEHVRKIDSNRNNRFPGSTGMRAASLDKKLGIDYQVYTALNMCGQRAIIKILD
jgi:hypothetical protein